MNPWTLAVIGFTVAVWIVYDFTAYYLWGLTATISWTIWTLSQAYPFIPFAAGCLVGHIFGQMAVKAVKKMYGG